MRFANWLYNGQPTGPRNTSTTEDGAYFVNGATTLAALNLIWRKVGWQWVASQANSCSWGRGQFHGKGSPAWANRSGHIR